jgi:hypothetical protein
MPANLYSLPPAPAVATGPKGRAAAPSAITAKEPLVDQPRGGLGKDALRAVPLAGSTPDPRHTDTLICALALHRGRLHANAHASEFAFVLSLIGWLQGIGPGLRDALRLAHANPTRHAPLLPRLVDLVLHERGVSRPAAEVLDDVLQPARLRLQLVEARMCLRHSIAFHMLGELEKLEAERGLARAEERMAAMADDAVLRVRDWLRMAEAATRR